MVHFLVRHQLRKKIRRDSQIMPGDIPQQTKLLASVPFDNASFMIFSDFLELEVHELFSDFPDHLILSAVHIYRDLLRPKSLLVHLLLLAFDSSFGWDAFLCNGLFLFFFLSVVVFIETIIALVFILRKGELLCPRVLLLIRNLLIVIHHLSLAGVRVLTLHSIPH
mmetsp:Transcript_32152/g.31468  ORF Transcript_32152/g.31468 Transcript_32152/m.31468 type:complete len:166 (+) Transcript_32152:1713-2210(+)